MKVGMLSAAGCVLITSAALAQTSSPNAPAAPPAANEPGTGQAAPAAPAEGEVQVRITPADINSFVKAAVKVNKIQADATLDQTQKQTAMVAAVQKTGLDPVKFNTIAEASRTNPELQQRIQTAAAQQQQPSE
jgi:hypothetical protein